MNLSMFKKKLFPFQILFWLPLLLSLTLFWQCDENPQNIALSDKTGEIVIDTLYANNDATYPINRKVSTLSANRLHLGAVNGFTFRTIMRFSNFPVDTIVIDTAWIRLETLGTNPPKESSRSNLQRKDIRSSIPGQPTHLRSGTITKAMWILPTPWVR